MNVPSLTILLAALGFATSASAANISFGTSTPPAGAPLAATGSNWDRELEARSWELFPSASQWQQRLLWLQEQENVKLDREKGTSYSIGIR
jgi:hypothetical protein